MENLKFTIFHNGFDWTCEAENQIGKVIDYATGGTPLKALQNVVGINGISNLLNSKIREFQNIACGLDISDLDGIKAWHYAEGIKIACDLINEYFNKY